MSKEAENLGNTLFSGGGAGGDNGGGGSGEEESLRISNNSTFQEL